jgi:phosphatidylglycerol---prolipoprotein diacylglyceryl transferase
MPTSTSGDARMRPILFVVPGSNFQIHSYGVMILLACFAALAIGVWRARRENIEANVVYELASWLFLGGVVGARGVYVLAHLDSIHSFGDILQSWKGGNVFYGCILGGLSGSILYWLRRPFPFWVMTDVAAPCVAIGIAIGRIGCFLNGCCHGAVCDHSWAVSFPVGSHAWVRQVDAGLISPMSMMSLPVHPTQLYASLAGFMLLGLLLAHFPRRRVAGEVMALLMIVYPVTRWPLEALRGDEPAILAGMTLSQNISVAVFACGLAAWFGLRGGLRASGATLDRSLPVRSPARFRLDGRRWAWHWHPDEPEAAANKGKTGFGRRDSEGAGQSRST